MKSTSSLNYLEKYSRELGIKPKKISSTRGAKRTPSHSLANSYTFYKRKKERSKEKRNNCHSELLYKREGKQMTHDLRYDPVLSLKLTYNRRMNWIEYNNDIKKTKKNTYCHISTNIPLPSSNTKMYSRKNTLLAFS